MPRAISRAWHPNRSNRVSPIDQRLAAALHLRQIESIIRTEAAADAAQTAFDDALAQLAAHVAGGRFDPFSLPWEVTRRLQAAINQAQVTLTDQLGRLAWWSHADLVQAYAASVPRFWFRAVSPAIAVVNVEEAKRERRDRKTDANADIPPQITGRGRRGGGGSGGTTAAPASPSPLQPPSINVGPLTATPHSEPVAQGSRLPDDEWEALLREHVFKPPDAGRVLSIVTRPDPNTGRTWQERFSGLSRLIQNPQQVADALVKGFSEGENIEQLRRRIQPLTAGVQASARRIARTEGLRIAETVQRESWSDLGDLMIGTQILAVMDENTRPAHAARNGRIFYKDPKPGQPGMDQMPQLPDAPNCRCWTTPVLAPPKAVEKSPAVAADFQNAAGAGIPDPSTYDQWFAAADEPRRKMAVGVRRYNTLAGELNGGRTPDWIDFVDPNTGELLPVSKLKSETDLQRAARRAAVQSAMNNRRRLLQQVSGQGFLTPQFGGR